MTPAPTAKSSLLPTYLQVAPLTLVLHLFFVVPVALVVVVSFFRYQMLVGIVPDFTFKNYIDLLTNPTTWTLYLSTLKFTLIVLVHHLRARLLDRLFPRLPRAQSFDRDRAFPGLHGAVLDVQHHPHDLVASGARQGRPDQQRADQGRASSTSRWTGCSSPISRWWSPMSICSRCS